MNEIDFDVELEKYFYYNDFDERNNSPEYLSEIKEAPLLSSIKMYIDRKLVNVRQEVNISGIVSSLQKPGKHCILTHDGVEYEEYIEATHSTNSITWILNDSTIWNERISPKTTFTFSKSQLHKELNKILKYLTINDALDVGFFYEPDFLKEVYAEFLKIEL